MVTRKSQGRRRRGVIGEYVEGLSVEEIAERRRLQPKTVRRLLRSANIQVKPTNGGNDDVRRTA